MTDRGPWLFIIKEPHDEKDAEICRPLSCISIAYPKRHLFCLRMLVHTAERPTDGVCVLFPASPAKCEVPIVGGDQQSLGNVMRG